MGTPGISSDDISNLSSWIQFLPKRLISNNKHSVSNSKLIIIGKNYKEAYKAAKRDCTLNIVSLFCITEEATNAVETGTIEAKEAYMAAKHDYKLNIVNFFCISAEETNAVETGTIEAGVVKTSAVETNNEEISKLSNSIFTTHFRL